MASQLELECLNVLWRAAPATVADVRESLPRPLAYTTVLTILDRMAVKGLVTRIKRGRAWAYAAAIDRETTRAQAAARLVENFFDGDAHAAAQFIAGSSGARKPRTRAAAATLRDTIDESLL